MSMTQRAGPDGSGSGGEPDLTLDPAFRSGLHPLAGETPGAVTIEAVWNPGNGAFATTSSIGGPCAFTGAFPFRAFSDNLSDFELGSNPFSMTTVISLRPPGGANLTQVGSQVVLAAGASPTAPSVPLPAAAPLLGAAVPGLGTPRRRRRA